MDIKGAMGPNDPSTLSNTRPNPKADLERLDIVTHASQLAYGLRPVEKAADTEGFAVHDLWNFDCINES